MRKHKDLHVLDVCIRAMSVCICVYVRMGKYVYMFVYKLLVEHLVICIMHVCMELTNTNMSTIWVHVVPVLTYLYSCCTRCMCQVLQHSATWML